MSDRTWNQIDARLYEEDWSRGARLVAGLVLARCPDQYGVFDFPLGYIKDFFQGIYTPMELTGFFQEWEAANFARFYRDGKVIWIRAKWKRAGKPSENHWKGLYAHLEGFPEVQEDFLSYYQPPSKGIQSPSIPPVNPESESESESESDTEKKKETNLSAKSADDIKKPAVKWNGKPVKPYIPIEDRKANTPGAKLVKYWHVRYEQVHRVKYSGDIIRMGGQSATLVKRNTAEDLAAGINFLLSSREHEQYHPHTWDHFVKNASKYILEAKDANYEPGFYID